EVLMHQPALALGVVDERRRPAEHVLEDLEPERRLVVRCRHDDAAGGHHLETGHGRRVKIGEEDENVVLLMMAAQVLVERGAPRALLLEPFHLVGAVVGVVVDPVRVLVERRQVAGAGVGEAAHVDAADAVGALGVLVLPRHVVARARREHVDLVLRGQPLGDESAEMLRAAEDLGAVALDHKGELHDRFPMMRARSRAMRSSPKSASRRRWPAITLARRSSSKASAPSSSAAYSRSFGANWTPAPPSVSGTAAAAYAST